ASRPPGRPRPRGPRSRADLHLAQQPHPAAEDHHGRADRGDQPAGGDDGTLLERPDPVVVVVALVAVVLYDEVDLGLEAHPALDPLLVVGWHLNMSPNSR